MSYKSYLLAVMSFPLLPAMYSCSEDVNEEDLQQSGKVYMEFRAGTETVSRTILVSENKVDWESGDAISLFDPSANNEFTTSGSGATVTFTGSAQNNQNKYYALYPYKAAAVISGSVITTTLPAEQTARAGSFDKMLNISVAESGPDKTLNFKNACAVVKFTLGENANSISKAMFRGNNGEGLAGELQVDAAASSPEVTVMTSKAETEVILTGGLTAGETYYFVVAPCVLEDGLTLTLYDADNKVWKRMGTSSVTLTAGKILDLGNINPGVFKTVLHISDANGLKQWAESSDKLTTDVILDADIDMTNQSWTPLGTDMSTGGYSGNFDGNGKTISNLTVSGDSNIGFFGGLTQGAKVYDVKFVSANINGSSSTSSNAGVVAGVSLGIIDNCTVEYSTISGHYAGAITGNNSVQVNNCNVLNITVNSGFYAGGIAGINYGKIEYCTVSGTSSITATGSSNRAGGIVGSNSEENNIPTSGRILKCAVNSATVSGVWAGGIAGENGFGTVAQCVVDNSNIIHEAEQGSTRLGGVVGYNSRGEVVASYSAGTTVGATDLSSEAIGGVVGYNKSSSIYGCYSTHVSLLGNASYKGAVSGYNNGNVTSCYADGISGVNLVGNGGTDHCVEVGATSGFETLVTGVGDLTVTDGTVWKATEIWNITSEIAPAINANYIGEGVLN